ncbi:MAG: tetratricopeptide repeat protein, partial [Clostridiaceae bacterium]|nr:tetratricopeptide repeat protein [Clostridiaceae bacterium]
MNIPMIFVAVITCLLALYTMNRFIKRPGVFSALLLLIQLLSASVSFFSILENVLTTPAFELSAIFAGVLLPAPVIVYDHCKAYKKIKKMGVGVPFFESREKKTRERWSVAAFTESPELWKEAVHARDVYRSLSIKDYVIKENIKKQLVLTQRLINLEHYEKAAERYRFLFSILPFSPLIAYNTGYLYCFTGKYRDAYKILGKALRMNKKGKDSLKESDDLEKSVKTYNAKDLDAMIHFNIGFALYNMKKYEHAIRHFQKVVEHKPDLAVAYKNIARACIKINMSDKAIEYLEKGRLDLRDDKMRIVLGSIYYSKGDTKKVLEVLDEAAGSKFKHCEGLLWRGKAAIREKEYDKAIECFKA